MVANEDGKGKESVSNYLAEKSLFEAEASGV